MLSGYSVFIFVIVLLLISWSLVTFWQRFLENFFYNTLGYDPNNTLISLWVAVLATSIFLLLVFIIKWLGLIPNLDVLIFDYNDDAIIGGGIDNLRSRPSRPPKVGGRTFPGGALFVSPNS